MEIKQKLSLINFTDINNIKRIEYLVIHYVGAVSSAKANADYFYNVYRGASAHYFVDEKEIWQVVADEDIAWHCGTNGEYKHPYCRNTNSMSIEMCVKTDNKNVWYFEEQTVKNTIQLAKTLVTKYNIPDKNLLRHYDITGKICPEPYVRNTNDWNVFKTNVFKKEESSEIPQYKISGEKYLRDMKYTLDKHDPLEIIDFGTLGTIFMSYDKVNNVPKK